ncbi:class I SAM-dependent methyltransferase [Vibrio parahaemolyticus]|nr:class I SAM-dependent methyltransferase [Vibrio parahaemolyticus]HCE4528952.1 class I SAM-dependent methyltransferase [Vibrio parahaemolyticus]HCG7284632.1 class I SAM-dependent methyltransferase [Vibrio parahaemolyticus]
MKWLDRLKIANYHRKRCKQFGNDKARTLGWQDEYSQISRFEALTRSLCLEAVSILDIGCGFGDLLEYIESQNQYPARYVGIDQQKQFITKARKRAFKTPVNFICGDFSKLVLPQSDYVFASGSLNYKSSNANHTIEMIEKMYRVARIGCVFNLLDEEKLPSMRMLESHNKVGVLRYCRWLCPDAQLIEGYSDHDFTIVMIKKAEPVS